MYQMNLRVKILLIPFSYFRVCHIVGVPLHLPTIYFLKWILLNLRLELSNSCSCKRTQAGVLVFFDASNISCSNCPRCCHKVVIKVISRQGRHIETDWLVILLVGLQYRSQLVSNYEALG